jgi:hypothetical protein
MTSQQERIETLENRLQDGFTRIGEAMNNGIEVEDWERHFENLVREYEFICDMLRDEPPVQSEMSLNVRERERDAA